MLLVISNILPYLDKCCQEDSSEEEVSTEGEEESSEEESEGDNSSEGSASESEGAY